jgi:hypothetical protein
MLLPYLEIPKKEIPNSMFEQSLEERCHEFGKRGKEVLQEI